MEGLEMAVLCVVWDTILECFNATSKTLQKVNIDLGTCVSLYESLQYFVKSIRTEEAFYSYEERAKFMMGRFELSCRPSANTQEKASIRRGRFRG
ncbi:Uncharacterised protein r2_g3789 [Pycnogonum litorale]